jgi:solute carrier family 25 citrate transporter 1
MQSIEARSLYKNSFHCAAKIFKEEGVLTFWSGAVPRLGRLILSGGIVFTMYLILSLSNHTMLTSARYEKSMEFMDKLDPNGIYI